MTNLGTIADGLSGIAIEMVDFIGKKDSARARELKDMLDRIDGYAADLRALDGQPQAGTSAYEMVAATATAQVETTQTLIHMVAATVLSVLIDEEGGGRSNIAFSPQAMDEMHRRYEMDAKHDGLLTTVSIKPREGMFDSLMLRTAPAEGNAVPMPPLDANLERKPEADMLEGEHEAPAKPQAAEHVYDRPLWAVRRNGKLVPCSDQAAAERKVQVAGPETIITIENRFCYHPDCPASGCTHEADAEVTSG